MLDVLKAEGYIRGYSTVDYDNGRTEFEIELKYFDGEPVIREIERVSRPGRRVYASVKNDPARRQRPRRVDPVDAEGRDVGCRGARPERRRRSALPRILGGAQTTNERIGVMSRIGKNPVKLPKGVTASVDGQAVSVKGPKGELSFTAGDEVTVSQTDGAIAVAPRDQSKRARAVWGMSRTMVANLVEGVTKGFEQRLEINGVGYARRRRRARP